jgi:hypothetical protein
MLARLLSFPVCRYCMGVPIYEVNRATRRQTESFAPLMSPSGNGRKSLAFRRSLEVKDPCADIYRTTSHTKYDLKYQLVWITKYRRAVLGGVVGTRVRELVRDICRVNDIEIVKGHVGKDHVHLFVSERNPPPFRRWLSV